MSIIYFLIRLFFLPLILAFFLIGGAVYTLFLGFAWVVIGESIRVWITYPDWRP